MNCAQEFKESKFVLHEMFSGKNLPWNMISILFIFVVFRILFMFNAIEFYIRVCLLFIITIKRKGFNWFEFTNNTQSL